MSKVYRWNPDSGSNRDVPDNYICLAQVMKEIAGDDTLKFVLLGKDKQETMFEVSGEGFLINGEVDIQHAYYAGKTKDLQDIITILQDKITESFQSYWMEMITICSILHMYITTNTALFLISSISQ